MTEETKISLKTLKDVVSLSNRLYRAYEDKLSDSTKECLKDVANDLTLNVKENIINIIRDELDNEGIQ